MDVLSFEATLIWSVKRGQSIFPVRGWGTGNVYSDFTRHPEALSRRCKEAPFFSLQGLYAKTAPVPTSLMPSKQLLHDADAEKAFCSPYALLSIVVWLFNWILSREEIAIIGFWHKILKKKNPASNIVLTTGFGSPLASAEFWLVMLYMLANSHHSQRRSE